MKKWFNVIHSDLVLEEKTNKKGDSYFILISSVFSNKRLRLNYAKNLIEIGLYIPLTEEILNKAINIKIDKTHLEMSFKMDSGIFKKEYIDKINFDEGICDIYVEKSLFNEEELIFLSSFLK